MAFYIDIDNPGEGNCAFYSFATALIDIIKREQKSNGTSVILDTWSKLSSQVEVGKFKDEILQFDYSNINTNLLKELQRSLRFIVYHAQLNQLKDSNNCINTDVYNKYAEIADNLFCGQTLAVGYNSLIENDEVMQNAMNLAKRLKRIAKWCHGMSLQEWAKYFDQQVLHAFRNNIYISDGILNLNSAILKSLAVVTQDYYWGTHSDLNQLAQIFNVNLYTLIDGKVVYPFKAEANEAVVMLNNHNDTHWTTMIKVTNEDVNPSTIKYTEHCHDSVVTKREIKAIFKSYTSGFMAFFTKRHHLAKAEEIIAACKGDSISVDDVINIIDDYTKKQHHFNFNSSFMKRAKYLLARDEYAHSTVKLIK